MYFNTKDKNVVDKVFIKTPPLFVCNCIIIKKYINVNKYFTIIVKIFTKIYWGDIKAPTNQGSWGLCCCNNYFVVSLLSIIFSTLCGKSAISSFVRLVVSIGGWIYSETSAGLIL